MLTTRGFWFFVGVFSLLSAGIGLGASQLILISLTLLAWFLAQWFLFQLRVRINVRRLVLERVLRTTRGAVVSVWAKQKVEVLVTLHADGGINLPYAIVTDRLPGLAQLVDGNLHIDGTLGKGTPLTWTYAILCKAPGRLRFEGVKVELADLQGFFTFATFVRDPREYRVLPALTVDAAQTAFVKLHNVLPLLGSHRHARPGGSSELLDLRDYMPGDPPKTIAWKVSARRDRLITREFESEVPIRCTIFLDTTNSVRLGPVGETALCRLIEIATGLAQANASERDLTGLCLFDETAVHAQIRAGRGSKHMVQMLDVLTRIAGATPVMPNATVRELLPYAYGVVQDVYPEQLDRDVNSFPWWLPFWSPQPGWTIPGAIPRNAGFFPWLTASMYWWLRTHTYARLSWTRHQEYQWRKQVSAILAIRYELGPGGLALLLDDDPMCARYMQRFLGEHQVVCPLPLYNEQGDSQFAAPAKTKVLADALLKAVTHGKDNELFVLCVDLFDCEDAMGPLERAICVARAKHHQVIVVAPWPGGVAAPGRAAGKTPPLLSTLELQRLLQQVFTARLQNEFARVKRTFNRLGVPVICAAQGDSIDWILHRMRRLRVQERGVR